MLLGTALSSSSRHFFFINCVHFIDYSPELILQEYAQAKKATSSPEYKQLIQEFIDKIVVGKYCVEITLKTGMDIFPSLDTSVQIKRQEIYEKKGEVS